VDKDQSEQVADIIKAAFLGQLTLDAAAERLRALGVTSIGIRGTYSPN